MSEPAPCSVEEEALVYDSVIRVCDPRQLKRVSLLVSRDPRLIWEPNPFEFVIVGRYIVGRLWGDCYASRGDCSLGMRVCAGRGP